MKTRYSVGDMMHNGYKYYIIFEVDNHKKIYRVFDPIAQRTFCVDFNSTMDKRWRKVA